MGGSVDILVFSSGFVVMFSFGNLVVATSSVVSFWDSVVSGTFLVAFSGSSVMEFTSTHGTAFSESRSISSNDLRIGSVSIN